ncbi:F420-dependent oxidoreductase-like protein [Halopolyspora algeriensis]|uniref:F420-dependent oxidoreductase-like protein n=1 Tax=Halopolyspora algeriensis TaxID=1500506 RepID=A0A368VVE7_9ACTN|nr:TIGR03560 family F420-dependent LLM class oxidoreductase [Halopolyspora algeriensis]RCW46064.1 F420-dependent oxidoreductase-like protein [Halopolyspora algeriensis]TQM55471.1 F420-dependent oxidoreductase-like protein [Halopolyspora algeriensis]
MRISLNITNYSWPGGPANLAGQLGRIARAADRSGLDTVWVPDHLLQADPTSHPRAEMLEAYTTLGFLAAQTRRVRLGTMVTGALNRPPALLVKAVTTLDVLSSGRAWLGIGAGYHNDEARAMGLPVASMPERFAHLEEILQLTEQMWAGDDAAFAGRHYRLEHPVSSPAQVTRPHPPILIGGMGEHRTLPLVARHADACNLFDVPDGGRTITRKLAVLAKQCAAAGRDYDAIDKTVSTRLEPGESAVGFARRCAELAELGIQHVVAITAGAWTGDTVETLAEATAVDPMGGTR